MTSYTPSQADVHVFKTLASAPDAKQYPHASRWYKHIASWGSEHTALPGTSKAGEAFVASAAAKEEEEDDVDLFGSDDEEVDEEAERIKQERVKAYQEKKSTKPKVAAKVRVCLAAAFE